MREMMADLWDLHEQGAWICITTNGTIKKNGECVMGAGCAKQAAQRYPRFPKALGAHLRLFGNMVRQWPHRKIITFPVKHNWYERADIALIKQSCQDLMAFLEHNPDVKQVFLPRPGVGNGKLRWKTEVKQAIAPLLDDRVVVVDFPH